MRREFSEEKRQEIFRLLDEIDNREWKSFMEWAGSRAEEYGDWSDKLAVSAYTRYVDAYHEKVLEINEMTRQQVNTVFENVAEIDARYAARMREHREKVKEQIAIVKTMTEFMDSMTNGNPNMALLEGGSVNESGVKKVNKYPNETRHMNQWMRERAFGNIRVSNAEISKNNDLNNTHIVKGGDILNRYLRSQLDVSGQCIYEGKVDKIISLINRNYSWMLSSLYVAECDNSYDSRIELKRVSEIVNIINDIINNNEKIINNLVEKGISEEYVIIMLIKLKNRYPVFYNNINKSSIDDIMTYFRYIEMQDMVAVACGEVGKARGIETLNDEGEGYNDVYYNDWYYGRDISDTSYAWCSVFVLWCANEVDLLDGNLFPTYQEAKDGVFQRVANLKDYFGDRYHSYDNDPDYIPCVGDFVFMTSNKGQNHVGIVVGYNNDTNELYTVEGNSGQKVSFRIRIWDGNYVTGLVNNGGDIANIPENIGDFEDGNNSSTR